MNIAAIINNINQAVSVKEYVDAYLLPVKAFSINYLNTFTIE